MKTFDTPEPISMELELGIADVQIVTSETSQTVVEVKPVHPEKPSDVTAAQSTEVEYTSGRLVVRAPKGRRQHWFKGGRESVEVHIDAPAGSTLSGKTAFGTLKTAGSLGAVDFHSGLGEVQIEDVDSLNIRSGYGGISTGRVRGAAEVKTGSGRVELGTVDGSAVVKNSNGDTHVGTISGDLRVQSANGNIVVGRSNSTVVAKTSNGNIKVGIGSRSSVGAHTACGQIDVDVIDPVAVWLDLQTHFGRVQSELDNVDQPDPGEDTAEVRARTAFGDITVRRVAAPVRT